MCVRAGEGRGGGCAGAAAWAGTSYRDKTHRCLVGTEYLMGLVAQFWDSALAVPRRVKLSIGASEGMSTHGPQELLLQEEEEVPEWEEGSAALVLGRAGSSVPGG